VGYAQSIFFMPTCASGGWVSLSPNFRNAFSVSVAALGHFMVVFITPHSFDSKATFTVLPRLCAKCCKIL
jgi:hypothetical protein